jgi:hypothetical protein
MLTRRFFRDPPPSSGQINGCQDLLHLGERSPKPFFDCGGQGCRIISGDMGEDMSIKDTLKSIALMYPENLVNSQLMDIDRIAFHIKLILDRKGNNITLLDVGGGIGLFSVGCSALGMNVMLIDDFRDPINYEVGNTVLEIHKKYGVNVISTK